MRKIINIIYRAYQKRQREKQIKKAWIEQKKHYYEIRNNHTLNKEMKQQFLYFSLRRTYVKMQLIRAQPYKPFFKSRLTFKNND